MGPQCRPAAPHPQPDKGGRRGRRRERRPRSLREPPALVAILGGEDTGGSPMSPTRMEFRNCLCGSPSKGFPGPQGPVLRPLGGHRHSPTSEAGPPGRSAPVPLVQNLDKAPTLLTGVGCGRARALCPRLTPGAVPDLGRTQPLSGTPPGGDRRSDVAVRRSQSSFRSCVHPRVLGPPLRPQGGSLLDLVGSGAARPVGTAVASGAGGCCLPSAGPGRASPGLSAQHVPHRRRLWAELKDAGREESAPTCSGPPSCQGHAGVPVAVPYTGVCTSGPGASPVAV